MNDEMSIYDICKLSQDIQMASNGRAVVNELGRVMTALSKHGLGSDEIMQHPAVICMIDKLSSLAGIQFDYLNKVFDAYDQCKRVMKE